MNTALRFARILAVTAFALSAAWLAGTTQSLAAPGIKCSNSLPPAGSVTSKPISCIVKCADGGTVASALRFQKRTTDRLVITIKGTCSESIDRVPSHVTLRGGKNGGALVAPNSSTSPVLGISGNGVIVYDLTLKGGTDTLLLRNSASVTAANLVISGGAAQDMLSRGIIRLVNSTVENSGGDGIDVEWGGTVYLEGGTVAGNAGWGALVSENSRLDVYNNAIVNGNTSGGILAVTGGALGVYAGIVENNSNDGILIDNGGVVDLFSSNGVVTSNGKDGVQVYGGSLRDRGGVILGNARHGVSVFNSGTAILEGGANIASNAANGVFVMDGTVTVGDLAGPATIQSNGSNGVYLKTNSVASFGNSGNQVINNGGWGLLCDGSPANPLYNGTVGTISGNTAGQTSCNLAP